MPNTIIFANKQHLASAINKQQAINKQKAINKHRLAIASLSVPKEIVLKRLNNTNYSVYVAIDDIDDGPIITLTQVN